MEIIISFIAAIITGVLANAIYDSCKRLYGKFNKKK